MTPAQFIQRRTPDWRALESLLQRMELSSDRKLSPDEFLSFGRLYRSACTDLSLSGAWRLPRHVQLYLEDLVSRSHSHLYAFHNRRRLGEIKAFFLDLIPRAVFSDRYVRICLLAFYLPFFMSMYLAYQSRPFAVAMVGETHMEMFEDMHSREKEDPEPGDMIAGTGFYVWNNAGLAVLTFGIGILGGVLSLVMVLFNAVFLGAILGYLMTTPAAENILSWIPGHGPVELTAIAFAGAAGLRVGFSFVAPEGRRRLRALREEAAAAVPVLVAAVTMLFIAAFLEATLAPAVLPIPVKFAVGGATLLLMIAYFGVNGGLRHRLHLRREAARLQAERRREPGTEAGGLRHAQGGRASGRS
ncbi:MAG: stage II sporulation protein M [bacterium]|nr:stage II sporulation protein M [bacterium]